MFRPHYHLFIYLSVHLFFCLFTPFPSVLLSFCLYVHPSLCASVHLSVFLNSLYLSVNLSFLLFSLFLSVNICLSLYLSICKSIFLSLYLSVNPSIGLLVFTFYPLVCLSLPLFSLSISSISLPFFISFSTSSMLHLLFHLSFFLFFMRPKISLKEIVVAMLLIGPGHACGAPTLSMTALSITTLILTDLIAILRINHTLAKLLIC